MPLRSSTTETVAVLPIERAVTPEEKLVLLLIAEYRTAPGVFRKACMSPKRFEQVVSRLSEAGLIYESDDVQPGRPVELMLDLTSLGDLQ